MWFSASVINTWMCEIGQIKPAMPSAMAGFARAILRLSRTGSIAFLAEPTLTSLRRARTRSALEIDDALRQHPAVADCAVIGVSDPEWGQRVAASVVLNDGAALDLPSLRNWAKQLLANYKLPSRLLLMDALPRNSTGNVMKPALAARFQTIRGGDCVG